MSVSKQSSYFTRGYSLLELSLLMTVLLPLGLAAAGVVCYLLDIQALDSVVHKQINDLNVKPFTLSEEGELNIASDAICTALRIAAQRALEVSVERFQGNGTVCSSDSSALTTAFNEQTGDRLDSEVLPAARFESSSYAGSDYFRLERALRQATVTPHPTAANDSTSAPRYLARTVLVGLRIACRFPVTGTGRLISLLTQLRPEIEQVAVVQLRGDIG